MRLAACLLLEVSAGQIVTSVALFVLMAAAGAVGYRPALQFLRWEEALSQDVLQRKLLMDIRPRAVTMLSAAGVGLLGLLGYVATRSAIGAILGFAAGAAAPVVVLRYLRKRRLARLDSQLVGGIQTLASGVRAGLNLVQSMQLLAQDGPAPVREEIAHLLREYEYGVPLEEAMDNAAARIGSGDYRLLFAALQTHRERGGDLGETLDRISESIREIQRLENRVKSLTAEGRVMARWLGALPLVVMAIIYFLVSPEGVTAMFTDTIGNLVLVAIVALNIVGFVWIRKIVQVDI